MSIFKSHFDLMGTYKPPLEGRDPDRFTLLDFNERTVPVSEPVINDIVDWVKSGRLQMYPSYGDVCGRIAEYTGVNHENIMITNGSDQGIDLVFRAACSAGDEVIVPGPAFPMYLQCADIENTKVHQPQYSKEKGYPLLETLNLINNQTRVIVVSNPNNPSGTSVTREDIVALAKAAPNAAILVDECYFEYCRITVADLVETHSNIIVTRTFSKTWGLPSLRLGYVVAARQYINTLLKIRGPYDVNQLAVVAVASALTHRDKVQAYVTEVMASSKPLFEAFLSERNIPFWPSTANFLWVFFSDAEKVEKHLAGSGILVRPKPDSDGKMGLRITLGTEKQTRTLISVLNELL